MAVEVNIENESFCLNCNYLLHHSRTHFINHLYNSRVFEVILSIKLVSLELHMIVSHDATTQETCVIHISSIFCNRKLPICPHARVRS